MATKNKETASVEDTAQVKGTAQVKDMQKYAVEKLQANCRQLFGVSASTFAGATYGMTGSYTIEEMKNHIEKWKKEGVN